MKWFNKIYKPVIKDETYHLPRTGGWLLSCSKCENNFVEPFDEKFKAYLYCPICGVKTK